MPGKKELDEMEAEMTQSSFITERELEEMQERYNALVALKSRLPMLYTARGNIIKVGGFKVSAKNFADINRMIDTLKNSIHPLVIDGETWRLIIHQTESDELRRLGQIEHLVLAGWKVSLFS